MKASDLIKRLQKLVENYGDQETNIMHEVRSPKGNIQYESAVTDLAASVRYVKGQANTCSKFIIIGNEIY